jgi:hypothetical protein
MLSKKWIGTLVLIQLVWTSARTQDVAALIQQVQAKIELVNSYQAEGTMITDVSFLKVPKAEVTVYFKKPGRFKIENRSGISLVPRSAGSISLSGLFQGRFAALDAGYDVVESKKVRVIKLLPANDEDQIVLSTLYIDPSSLLVLKARTTTRENGTYEVALTYGKYAAFALPDQVTCSFNTKDYKLPKGVTFDYDDGTEGKNKVRTQDEAKGKVLIQYHSYQINKPIPDSIF